MNYSIRQTSITEESIVRYSKFLSMVFSNNTKFSPDFIRWLYADNPSGEVIGYDAWLGDELVAHYATIPVEYLINNQRHKGLLSLNTATHKDHQGKGLFVKLAKKTYELGRMKGFDFVIGVANNNSTHGFINNLEFKLISSLDAYIGIGNIRSRKNNVTFFYNNLSDAYVKWRLSNPSNHYYSEKSSISSATDFKLISAVISSKYIPGLKNRFHLFNLWIGIAPVLLKKGFFIKLPSILKPSPLNLILKDLK